MTKEFFLYRKKNIYFPFLLLSKYENKMFYFIYLDGTLNNTDDSQHKQQSSAVHLSKRKASFR